MKLNVQRIEEIVITDPAGLCNPPVPQLPPGRVPPGVVGPPRQAVPIPSGMYPNPPPGVPSPFQPQPRGPALDPYPPGIPGIRPLDHRIGPAIYTKPNDSFAPLSKWGVGGEAIQQAGRDIDQDGDPEKWEKNWQAEKGKDGNRSTH